MQHGMDGMHAVLPAWPKSEPTLPLRKPGSGEQSLKESHLIASTFVQSK